MSHPSSLEGTNVMWALQVAPTGTSADLTNALPFTHLLTDNIVDALPPSLLPQENQTVPFQMILDDPNQGLLYSLEEKDGQIVARLITQPITPSNPPVRLIPLDRKIIENQVTMKAVPLKEIQRQDSIYKEKRHLTNVLNTDELNKNNKDARLENTNTCEQQETQEQLAPLPTRVPPRAVKQNTTFVHLKDSRVIPRAVASLPPALQRLRGTIFTKKPIPAWTKFGPLQGVQKEVSKEEVDVLVTDAIAVNKPIFLVLDDDNKIIHMDVSDQDKSNWLSLVPIGEKDKANLWLYEEHCELFAVTSKFLSARTPLTFGFSIEYALRYCLPEYVPMMDIVQEVHMDLSMWRCDECGYTCKSPALLQRHLDLRHKVGPYKPRRRQYRCKGCPRVFSRVFCLKRHIRLYCRKKEIGAEDEAVLSNGNKNNSLSENLDDVRLPSDDSFQNILDFSSSLFDPDKTLPNLDISSGSNSESLQDPSLSSTSNDPGLHSLGNINEAIVNLDTICSKDKNSEQWPKRPTKSVCQRCQLLIPDEAMAKHVGSCRGKKFECFCGCGCFFNNKDLLAKHIHSRHPDPQVEAGNTNKDQPTKTTKEAENVYNCEDCSINFKRRGMMVNHIWRVHPERAHHAAAVPVVKQVKYYLCSACPKLYRTSAKRDKHVIKHHPGHTLDLRGSLCVGGGVETGSAAECSFCPRQYVTRAKLLQHIRLKHS